MVGRIVASETRRDRSRAARTIVSYDVASHRRRARVSKVLLSVGDRVQKSVFECSLTVRERDELLTMLSTLIDTRTDSIRCYIQCANCDREMRAWPADGRPAIVVV